MTKPRDDSGYQTLKALMESTEVLVGAFAAEDLTVLVFNSALERLFAGSKRAVLRIGATLEDVFGSCEAEFWRAHFLRALSQGSFGIEHGGLVEGRVFWVSFNKVMVDSRCLGVSLFCRDITEVYLAVSTGKSAEDRFAKLFRANPCPLQVNDATTGIIIDINNAFAQWLGYQPSELIGHTTLEFGIWVDVSARRKMLDILMSAGHVEGFEARYRHRNGGILECLVACEAIVLDGKRCYLVSVTDITARRRLEQEAAALRSHLAHAQRMEALGRLASGVAHDFNNLLGAIMGHLELALSQAYDGEMRALLEETEQATRRAMHLVGQIRAFGRQNQDKRPLQVSPLVKEAVKLLRVGLPQGLVVKEQYHSSGWVIAEPTQIHQVTVNLFTNARLATGDRGGTLDIRVEERALDPRLIPKYPWAKPGPHLCLTVKDTGCGMSTETMEHIFDPFFTTRPGGQGTGLGLSVVYGIVKDIGGAIDVQSEPGAGSTFAVYLPLSEPGSTESGPAGPRVPSGP